MKESKWSQGVAEYMQEMREYLDDEKLELTKENLLNGARDWREASYGGNWLVYDDDIAERLATPSEIKSRTSKSGVLSSYANKNETWLDVQARALFQACHKLIREQRKSEITSKIGGKDD